MKLVCLARSVDSSNGWGRVAYEVLKVLTARNVETSVFAAAGSTNDAIDGLEVHERLARDGSNVPRPIGAVLDAVKIRRATARPNAVVAFDEPSVLAAGALASSWQTPLFALLHGTYAITTLRGRSGWLHRRVYDRARTLLCVSRYTRARFASEFPSHRAALELMPLGVDQALVSASPPPFHARRREILTVGEVKARKGLLQTVEALALIPSARRPQILVAGAQTPTNEYVKSVRERARSLGVEHHLEFLGSVGADELERLYLRAAAFVLPSQNVGDHFEGFGLVHLEAAARGLPAIGSRDCGNEDAILDGVTGHLCAQQNAAELAACIDRLLSDEAHWSACSAESVKWARSMPWSKTADALIGAVQTGQP